MKNKPYISLEHIIRNVVNEGFINGPRGDKPQGTPKPFYSKVFVKPHDGESGQGNKGVQSTVGRRLNAKEKTSEPIKMESAPSDMSGVSLQHGAECECGCNKKKIKESGGVPNYGDAASVASWAGAQNTEDGKKKIKEAFGDADVAYPESGKKKVKNEGMATFGGQGNEVGTMGRVSTESGKKKIKEDSESEGTKERREVEYVGRPDSAKPTSKKSKLGRNSAYKTNVIDEQSDLIETVRRVVASKKQQMMQKKVPVDVFGMPQTQIIKNPNLSKEMDNVN